MKRPSETAIKAMAGLRCSYCDAPAYCDAPEHAAELLDRALAAERRRIRKAIRIEREIVIGRWDALARERDAHGDGAGKQCMREAKARILQGLDAALASVRVERKRKP